MALLPEACCTLSLKEKGQEDRAFTSLKDKENRWVTLVRALFSLMVHSSEELLKSSVTSTWCLAYNLNSE